MKRVICFFDNFTDKEVEIVNRYDDELHEVHLYTDCVNSSEKSPFFCLGEIATLLMNQENGSIFVTNHRHIYDWVKEWYNMYCDEIVMIDQEMECQFEDMWNPVELLQYECQMACDAAGQIMMQQMIDSLNPGQHAIVWNMFVDFGTHILQLKLEKEKKHWLHFCKVLIYILEQDVKVTKEKREYVLGLYESVAFLSKEQEAVDRYIKELLADANMNHHNRYFVWNQMKMLSLRSYLPHANGDLLDQLYESSYNGYLDELKSELVSIPKEDRNENCVVVFAMQYLGVNHAPTKTTRERCEALLKLGREVYLINTKEQCTENGIFSGPLSFKGNVIPELDGWNDIELNDGSSISCYQPAVSMPNVNEIRKIIGFLNEKKPGYAISIGNGSIVADLCDLVVPTFPMNLVFSTLPKTISKHVILGRSLRDEERSKFEEQGLCVLESRFTFQVKPQKEHFTRTRFGLPEDAFLLVVTGIRLDADVSEEFIEQIETVLCEDIHIVFAGIYNNYDAVCSKHETLNKYSTFIGYCNDMLALMEIVDLYINPPRLGGGFSVIEAFCKSVPGTYMPVGDVYVAGGEEFVSEDYPQMLETIKRYKEDREFYDRMVKKAVARAELMTDSVRAIRDLEKEIKKHI